MKLWKSRCDRNGHRWLLGVSREFIPVHDFCVHCKARTVWLPWGMCLGGHRIAEHYDANGRAIENAPNGCLVGWPA